MITEINHNCGQKLGIFDSADDHGSFEMRCPKCHKWVEIFIQFIAFPEGAPEVGPHHVTYTQVKP